MKVGLVVLGGSVLVALGVGSCCTSREGTKTVVVEKPVPVAVPAPAPVLVSCDLSKRTWVQRSSGPCASSTWRFMRLGDGTWQATETGCGGATGRAIYDGSVLTVSFTYPEGTGIYTWPLDAACRSVPGTVRWTSGPLTGKAMPSTLSAS